MPQCLLCGASATARLTAETRMIRSMFGAEVVSCRRCGLVFAWPRPAQTDAVYDEGYFQAHADAGFAVAAEPNLGRYRDRLMAVAASPGRLLEIGVGQGGFMQAAAELGWTVTGLDVSQYAADVVAQRFGLPVKVGRLGRVQFDADGYDVVHMSHVLEHLDDPRDALIQVRQLLRPGGRVIIEVPHELRNLYTWLRLRSGTAVPYRIASSHLWFFAPSSLQRLLNQAGFSTVLLRTFRDVNDPRGWRRLAKSAVGLVERAVNRGPLIEAVAVSAGSRPGANS